MSSVVARNDHTVWYFLHFAAQCLRLPSTGGKRWTLVSAVSNLVKEESDPLSASGKPGHHSKLTVLDEFHNSLRL